MEKSSMNQFSIALGMEINYKTRGEPVGEGAILLAGVSLTYEI